MANRNILVLFLAASLIWLLGNTAVGQAVPSQVDPNNLTGIMPYNTYGGVRENINLGTGGLNLHIPLVSLPGRNGHDFSLGLLYDSKVWNLHQETDQFGTDTWWDDDDQIGWHLDLPTLVATSISVPVPPNQGTVSCTGNYILVLPDGSKHQFFPPTGTTWTGARTNCWRQPPTGNPVPYTNILTYATNDAAYFYIDLTNSSDVVVYEKNGERFHFAGSPSPGQRANAAKVEDANGNLITISSGVVTDTLGRTISAPGCNGTCSSTITYKDSNGISQTITLNWTSATLAPTFVNPGGVGATVGPYHALTSVVLPTGRSYTFQYDNGATTFAELTKITYPTGGYTRFHTRRGTGEKKRDGAHYNYKKR